MKCSCLGCEIKSIAVYSLMGVKFGYCKKHKKHINKITNRTVKHRFFEKRKRFGVYELGV